MRRWMRREDANLLRSYMQKSDTVVSKYFRVIIPLVLIGTIAG